MILKNAWYVAGWDTELQPGGLLSRKILDVNVVIYRKEDGSVAALEDRCCHRFAPLSMGRLEGDNLRCMYHGLMFDPAGHCVEVPGQTTVNNKLRVRSFPVVERDHFIWIWMGNPTLASADDIFPEPTHTLAGDGSDRGGYMHFAAAAQLVADNLLDFSHLAFVHLNTLGTSQQANVRAAVEKMDDGVKIRFTTPNTPVPPAAKGAEGLPDIVDRFQVYTWRIKGNIFVQDSILAPAGEGPETQNPHAIRTHTVIALTPKTDTSTHYFWSVTRANAMAPERRSKLWDIITAAFEEDRAMIEAQQRVILQTTGVPMAVIPADGALTQVRRMLDKLLVEEREHSISSGA
jgi:phenylpropionate dioxygenase-like ring-hydroxylating dioxygenase large terminal subunit